MKFGKKLSLTRVPHVKKYRLFAHDLKARLHIQIKRVFSSLCCILGVLTLSLQTNAENVRVNGMWQLSIMTF